MKKLFSLLGSCLLLIGNSQAATLTVSNYNPTGNGNFGIADSGGTRFSGSAARGIVGRMNGLTDQQAADKATAGDITGLNAAFQPFNTDFALDSLGQSGAFETEIDFDTRASVRPGYGGSPIYVWFYKGASRTTATEYLLVRLTSLFPTDSEVLAASSLTVAVNPAQVAQILAGASGPAKYDYGQGSGELNLYQTISTSTSSNVAPIANNGVLAAFSGVPKNGVLIASDANNDVLTYSKVSDPTKGIVTVQSNGNFTYTANAGELGADSFTFKVSDGAVESAVATISITISEPPPNEAPVAVPGLFSGKAGDIIAGNVSGTDTNSDPLTFAVGTGPTSGVLTSFTASGAFVYRPNSGFFGTDSFTFTANDGTVSSAPATIQLVVEQPIPAWVWIDGDKVVKQRGIYGTRGTAAAANKPGARTEAATVSGPGGISYHFGGLGYGEGTKSGMLNDLWSYNSVTREWTWLSGGKEVDAVAVHGTKGTPAPLNVPGARSGALIWLDDSGNLWVFGGASSTKNLVNDLWKYNLTGNEWTWVSGSETPNATGTYGTAGQPAVNNAPGARANSVGWQDASGRLFVFGGRGLPASGVKVGLLNDLWVFDAGLGQWTWLKGGNGIDAIGVYAPLGSADKTNLPGGRSGAVGWAGNSGNLWLFGGSGRGNAAKAGNLNDLWEYNFLANEWTWVSGSAAVNAVGVYGSLGLPAPANTPGARAGAASWLAADGSLLLFGGQGTGHLNDVWRFDPEEKQWAWIKGPSTLNGLAIYGDLNVSSPSSTPGARRGSSAFTDGSGNLILFAGTNAANSNNDVWLLDVPEFPVVDLLPVRAITGDSATVTARINPNGSATSAKLRVINLNTGGEGDEIDLGPIGGGSTPVTVTEELTDLDTGTRYAVLVKAENLLGDGLSLVRIFTTTGAVPALVANFEESSSQSAEAAGSVGVKVVLNSPATVPFTLPITITGDAAEGATGDFVASPPSLGSLSFVIGQTEATVNVTIRDDANAEGNELVIITLGAPSDASVTVGLVNVHTLTIQDNDSAPAFVSAPGPYLARLGSKVVFNGTVTGSPVIGYQWNKGGKAIAKATLPTYTLASVKLTDFGSYGVNVQNSLGTVSGSFDLAVVDTSSRSVVQAAGTALSVKVLAEGSGLTYAWQKAGEPIGQTTNTLSIASSTAADSGDYVCVVSKAGTESLVTGIIRVHIFEETVATPAFLAGNYVGVVQSREDLAPLGGRLDLSVTPKGAYTAKLVLGTTALTGRGQLYISGSAAAAEGQSTVSFPRKGLPNLTFQFKVLGNSTTPVSIGLQGTLIDPFGGAEMVVLGYRNQWVAKPKVGSADASATRYAGSYTFGLDLPTELVGVLSLPQGNGFGALTATTAGTASWAGRTADGGKFTMATIIGPEGQVPFYSAFTVTPGYLLGVASITPAGTDFDSNGLGESLSWKKLPADAKSKEVAYRAGFEEVSLTMVGGKWQGPASGSVIAGLTNAVDNTVLDFSEGGAELANVQPFTFSIRNLKTTGVVQTVVIDKTRPNPNTVTFKLIAKPAGHFSGTFAVPNSLKTLVRTSAYQGTFIRLSNGSFTSAGFFLLAQPPEPGQTVKTAPQLSGQVFVGSPR